MSGPDQRIHARIHVSTKIEITTPDGRLEAELKDLSKGGARFLVSTPVGKVGESLEIFLPSLDGRDIIVTAQVIRHEHTNKGHMFAVRFDEIAPTQQQALLDLIEVLLSTSSSAGGRRAHARVARRIEIRFGQLDDLRAILEDISSGGLLMTVAEPLVLYEEVDITVPDMSGGELIILHARVVNQRAVSEAPGAAYRVGLEFANLRPEALLVLEALLKSVVAAAAAEDA
jgi:c-di-GMP-binding flagellar brake protein YcgR